MRSTVSLSLVGFQGGTAIAQALFGDYNPGGKLTYTLYSADYTNQVDMRNMDFSLAPGRSYRWYTGKPMLGFGYGLSYTTFKLTHGKQAQAFETPQFATEAAPSWSQQYSVTVTNTGARHGDEVVQAYMTPPATAPTSSGGLPMLRQLFGFERVSLRRGPSVILPLPQ